jgi:GR25 family glycosyltransferase involved in LPS biosynthesis
MINDYFDKVLLINLPSATDRLKKAEENCDKVGIKFERWEATSGKEDFIVMNKEAYQGWNRNASALAYTTLKIVEKAKQEGWKNVFIMEDDVDFISSNFNSILKTAMEGLPEKWDFFHLNVTNQYSSKWVAPCLHRLKGAWCCQAYAINSHMYDRYILELKKFDMPIDNITLNLHKERMNSYSTMPNIVVHNPGQYSTLRETLVDY